MLRSATASALPFAALVPLLALLVGTAACDSKSECNEAELAKLAEAAPKSLDTTGEDNAERKRTSAGIRAACTSMPDWMTTRMQRAYEGENGTADEMAERLAGDEGEEFLKASASLRKRVCPNVDDVFERMNATEGRGVTATPAVPAGERAKFIWKECDLARFGVHSNLPTESSPRVPGTLLDFAVFLFLQDSGATKDTATAVTRSLGAPLPDPAK